MAVAAILNLLPVAIFTYSRLSIVDFNHHTKFRANGRPPSWIVQNLISDQWVSLGY